MHEKNTTPAVWPTKDEVRGLLGLHLIPDLADIMLAYFLVHDRVFLFVFMYVCICMNVCMYVCMHALY